MAGNHDVIVYFGGYDMKTIGFTRIDYWALYACNMNGDRVSKRINCIFYLILLNSITSQHCSNDLRNTLVPFLGRQMDPTVHTVSGDWL